MSTLIVKGQEEMLHHPEPEFDLSPWEDENEEDEDEDDGIIILSPPDEEKEVIMLSPDGEEGLVPLLLLDDHNDQSPRSGRSWRYTRSQHRIGGGTNGLQRLQQLLLVCAASNGHCSSSSSSSNSVTHSKHGKTTIRSSNDKRNPSETQTVSSRSVQPTSSRGSWEERKKFVPLQDDSHGHTKRRAGAGSLLQKLTMAKRSKLGGQTQELQNNVTITATITSGGSGGSKDNEDAGSADENTSDSSSCSLEDAPEPNQNDQDDNTDKPKRGDCKQSTVSDAGAGQDKQVEIIRISTIIPQHQGSTLTSSSTQAQPSGNASPCSTTSTMPKGQQQQQVLIPNALVRRRRPKRRLNLARKWNWRYLTNQNEIIQWKRQVNWMKAHRKGIMNQKHTIRTLRISAIMTTMNATGSEDHADDIQPTTTTTLEDGYDNESKGDHEGENGSEGNDIMIGNDGGSDDSDSSEYMVSSDSEEGEDEENDNRKVVESAAAVPETSDSMMKRRYFVEYQESTRDMIMFSIIHEGDEEEEEDDDDDDDEEELFGTRFMI